MKVMEYSNINIKQRPSKPEKRGTTRTWKVEDKSHSLEIGVKEGLNYQRYCYGLHWT